MSGEKPGKRRGAVLALASLGIAFLLNTVLFVTDQPAAQQPAEAATRVEVVAPDTTASVGLSTSYSLQIQKIDERIKLKGQISSEEDHRTILGLIKGIFASKEVKDFVRSGKSNPSSNLRVGGLSFALKVLGHLEGGIASVDERSVTIEGKAGIKTPHSALQKILNFERPTGVNVRVNITPAFYWRAEMSNGHVIITGDVSSDTDKRLLSDAAQEQFNDLRIANHTKPAGDVLPEEWMPAVMHSLKVLRHLQHGVVHIKDLTVHVEGIATDQHVLSEVSDLTDHYPRVFAIELGANALVPAQKSNDGFFDLLPSLPTLPKIEGESLPVNSFTQQ